LEMKGIVWLAFCLSVAIFHGKGLGLASELRQTGYVFEDSVVSWKEKPVHVICDDCRPLKKVAWSPADFAKKIVRIRVPLTVPMADVPKTLPAAERPTTSGAAGKGPVVVYFDFDSSSVKKEDLKKLRAYVHGIGKSLRDKTIEVTGYTDGVGTKEYNDGLARRRAEAVFRALLSMGLPADAVTVKGKGRCCYMDKDARNWRNRRVEVIVHKKGPGRLNR